MLQSNILYIASWYFGSDYMTRKLFRLYSGKEKPAYVQYLNYSNCFIQLMGSGSNWYQIGNKACYILKVCKFYIEKLVFMVLVLVMVLLK